MNINIKTYGQGYPLILFHGWGFDSGIWQHILEDLTVNFKIHCVDLPGFGQSRLMPWLAFKRELLKAIPGNFALLGWSLGGLFASRLAIEAPDRVSKLINVASTPRFIADKQWPGVDPSVFDGFYNNLMNDQEKVVSDFIKLQSRGALKSIDYEANYSAESLQRGLSILKQWDLRSNMETIKSRTCYMFGRLDAIIPINTFKQMQVQYPCFDYIYFKKSAHMPFISHKQEFLEALRSFIL